MQSWVSNDRGGAWELLDQWEGTPARDAVVMPDGGVMSWNWDGSVRHDGRVTPVVDVELPCCSSTNATDGFLRGYVHHAGDHAWATHDGGASWAPLDAGSFPYAQVVPFGDDALGLVGSSCSYEETNRRQLHLLRGLQHQLVYTAPEAISDISVDPAGRVLVELDPDPESFDDSTGRRCQVVGSPCPEGDWAEALPEGSSVVYVRPGAQGGSGSRDEPFGTIVEALAAAEPAAVIALAKGTYDEAVVVESPVTLWGACVRETIVGSSTPDETAPTLRLGAGAVAVGNLTVAGERTGIEVTRDDGVVQIESVQVRDVSGSGIVVRELSSLEARDLVVRDVAAVSEDDGAVVVRPGASAELDRAMLERDAWAGLVVEGGRLGARDLGVVDVRPLQDDGGSTYLGECVRAWGGAQVELERAAFARGGSHCLMASQTGTRLVARDVSISEPGPYRDSYWGGSVGIGANHGAEVDVTRGTIERANEGVTVYQSPLRLSDLIVTDASWGIWVGFPGDPAEPAQFIERLAIVRGTFGGLGAWGGRSTIADMTIRDCGAGAWLSSVATLDRVRMERVIDVGLFARSPYADVVARDITVEFADVEGAEGTGIGFADGARGSVERAVITAGGAAPLWARSTNGVIELSDIVVRGAHDRQHHRWGFGLIALLNAQVRLRRAVIAEIPGVSIQIWGGGVLTAEDVVVQDTLEAECVVDTCPTAGAGMGVMAADDGSAIDLTRFRIERSALCGVQVADGAGLDLHQGVISTSPIGANVQSEDFDLRRLQDQVRWVDVRRRLDATALPVPRLLPGE